MLSQKDITEMILWFLIIKLSFMNNLDLSELDAKISKLSKVMRQLNCSRWSDFANSLFLICFPVRFKVCMYSDALFDSAFRDYFL